MSFLKTSARVWTWSWVGGAGPTTSIWHDVCWKSTPSVDVIKFGVHRPTAFHWFLCTKKVGGPFSQRPKKSCAPLPCSSERVSAPSPFAPAPYKDKFCMVPYVNQKYAPILANKRSPTWQLYFGTLRSQCIKVFKKLKSAFTFWTTICNIIIPTPPFQFSWTFMFLALIINLKKNQETARKLKRLPVSCIKRKISM